MRIISYMFDKLEQYLRLLLSFNYRLDQLEQYLIEHCPAKLPFKLQESLRKLVFLFTHKLRIAIQ